MSIRRSSRIKKRKKLVRSNKLKNKNIKKDFVSNANKVNKSLRRVTNTSSGDLYIQHRCGCWCYGGVPGSGYNQDWSPGSTPPGITYGICYCSGDECENGGQHCATYSNGVYNYTYECRIHECEGNDCIQDWMYNFTVDEGVGADRGGK